MHEIAYEALEGALRVYVELADGTSGCVDVPVRIAWHTHRDDVAFAGDVGTYRMGSPEVVSLHGASADALIAALPDRAELFGRYELLGGVRRPHGRRA